VLARVFILQGRPLKRLSFWQVLLDQARQMDRIDLTIEIQILKALAFQREGEDDKAIEALAEALSLAEPGSYIRIFLDEGEPMTRLLRLAASRGLATTYVSKLLSTFDKPAFTERETGLSSPPSQLLIEALECS